MRPLGSEGLFAMRLAGKRPSTVFIEFGEGPAINWRNVAGLSPTLRISPSHPIERLDLRCLLACDVVLTFEEWDDRINTLEARIQEYATCLYIVSMSLAPDMGWCWHRDYGHQSLGQLHWALQFDEARKTSCYTQAEHARRIALEQEAMKHAPWLREREVA